MKTAVIIVNYNKKDLLEKCLLSLQQNDYPDAYAIVVDNGSTDGSREMVREKFSRVQYVEMGYNSGFCKANNVGIQKAIDDGCEVIVLLNNDTEVDKDFIAEGVKEIAMDKKVGMVAPKILFHTHRDRFDSAGLIITQDGLAVNRLLDRTTEEGMERCEVFCPAGAAAFFHADVLIDIKQDGMYFDEDFAYYLEDLDMGWRARLRGWSCVYTPHSIVYHLKNATSGGYSKFIAFHTNRNLFYNIIKNYPGRYFLRALFLAFVRYPALLFGIFFRKGAANRFHAQIGLWDVMTAAIRGWCDVVTHIGTLMRKRRYIQKRISITRAQRKALFTQFGLRYFDSLYK